MSLSNKLKWSLRLDVVRYEILRSIAMTMRLLNLENSDILCNKMELSLSTDE